MCSTCQLPVHRASSVAKLVSRFRPDHSGLGGIKTRTQLLRGLGRLGWMNLQGNSPRGRLVLPYYHKFQSKFTLSTSRAHRRCKPLWSPLQYYVFQLIKLIPSGTLYLRVHYTSEQHHVVCTLINYLPLRMYNGWSTDERTKKLHEWLYEPGEPNNIRIKYK